MNINYMPLVIFFACLDFEKICMVDSIIVIKNV